MRKAESGSEDSLVDHSHDPVPLEDGPLPSVE